MPARRSSLRSLLLVLTLSITTLGGLGIAAASADASSLTKLRGVRSVATVISSTCVMGAGPTGMVTVRLAEQSYEGLSCPSGPVRAGDRVSVIYSPLDPSQGMRLADVESRGPGMVAGVIGVMSAMILVGWYVISRRHSEFEAHDHPTKSNYQQRLSH